MSLMEQESSSSRMAHITMELSLMDSPMVTEDIFSARVAIMKDR
jgi:hypothetical protein